MEKSGFVRFHHPASNGGGLTALVLTAGKHAAGCGKVVCGTGGVERQRQEGASVKPVPPIWPGTWLRGTFVSNASLRKQSESD